MYVSEAVMLATPIWRSSREAQECWKAGDADDCKAWAARAEVPFAGKAEVHGARCDKGSGFDWPTASSPFA